MSQRENISYLVPRDPSITCWEDRIKFPGPCAKNLIQLGLDECEETMGEKIKVYLRLKPSACLDNPYTVLNSNTLQTEAPKDSISYRNVTNGVGKLIHKFTFTSILNQDTSQSDLFKKCAIAGLKKFLSGENYLLMAYGTTSAGKTFTMQGNVEHPGVIPRALDFVFTSLKGNITPVCKYQPYQYNEFSVLTDEQARKDLSHKNYILSLDLTRYQRYPDASHLTGQTTSSSGFSDSYENVTFKEMQSNLGETENFEMNSITDKYSVWISMMEIYNEQVYDLLEFPNERGMRLKLTFRDDEYGNTFVKGLRYVSVSSGHEAFQILQFGRNNLHMAPTALNERSSRSHCIFVITLAKFIEYEKSSEAIVSRFSFCDLAGTERAKKTLNVKDRLVESKAINTSLSILVKCLTTIKENQNSKEKKIIPYRESKLTKLFRDAVTGKEQFSLIVNVTSEPNLFDETLSVLKFSSIAQKIVPVNVLARPKMLKPIQRSRLSKIVMNWKNTSKTIDWDASTVIDSRLKNDSECNAQDLQALIRSLREELVREKERCKEIESQIRCELTSQFSEMMQQQNHTHKTRLEKETERLKEMHRRKEQRIINYYEIIKNNKRQKIEEDDSDYQDELEKLRKAEKDVEVLTAQNEALKERIQILVEDNNKAVSECSKLKFEIVEKDRVLEQMQKTKEASEAGSDALVKELQKQLSEANAKVTDYKNLLDEAAADFLDLSENNKFLRKENEILEEQVTEHLEKVADLKAEVQELQRALSQKRIKIEKLEEAQEKLNQELQEKNENETHNCEHMAELEIVREQLKGTSEMLNQNRKEFNALKAEKSQLEEDLENARLKIEELQSRISELGVSESNKEKPSEDEKRIVLESSSDKEDSPFVNLKKKNVRAECTPERLTKQIEALSLQQPEGKSIRKKVDLLDGTIHPSTVKNTNKGRRKNGKKDKEKEVEKTTESEKENIPIKKKSKCYKQLFIENDFDGLTDLNASPLEDIPRLRPRK